MINTDKNDCLNVIMASTHPDLYARWNASEYVYSLKYSSFDVLEKSIRT